MHYLSRTSLVALLFAAGMGGIGTQIANAAPPRSSLNSAMYFAEAFKKLKQPGVTDDDLTQSFRANQNFYVYVMQSVLAESGSFTAKPSGLLTKSTTKALIDYCRAHDLEDVCARGPLTDEAIAAVAKVLASEFAREALAPVAEGPAPPAAEPEVPAPAEAVPLAEAPAEAAEPAVAAPSEPEAPAVEAVATSDAAPQGWRIEDAPGLTHTVTVEGDTVAITFTGTTDAEGFANIYPGQMANVKAGETWKTSARVGFSASGKVPVALISAVVSAADGKYLGRLYQGDYLAASSASASLHESSAEITQADAALIAMFVQYRFAEGEALNFTLTLSNAKLEQVGQ